jgi:signal transduction histidine kinase
MLCDFIASQRADILALARLRVASRAAPVATQMELTEGLPLFLDQLGEALGRATSDEAVNHEEIGETARLHGDELFRRGLSVAQVVHDYGDLCQVITGLVIKQKVPIDATEFRTLNLCLDDAIAGAVTAYGRRRERMVADEGTENLGILAHELRNALNAAVIAFGSIKKGTVATGGSTSAMLDRSLARMAILIDRSLASVRVETGKLNLERVAVAEIIEEVEIGGAIVAQARGLRFEVTAVDRTIVVDADRSILAAAIANLVQNAFKFTLPGTKVTIGARTTMSRVLIEVEDECGGLPPGDVASLLRPFAQGGSDRTGVGLGLAICVKAVEAMAGELHIRDLPGKGCVFTVDLPRQQPASSLMGRV